VGALLSAECSTCGYTAEIFAGFGFSGIEMEPHLCHDCREIVDVVVAVHLPTPDAPDLGRCPRCGGIEIQPLTYPLDGSLEEPQRDGGVDCGSAADPCPKCEGLLTVSVAGVWD
jgi:hypothetical protein